VAVTAAAAAVWITLQKTDPAVVESERAIEAAAEAPVPRSAEERIVSEEIRNDALSRARIWREPDTPASQALFRVPHTDTVSCRFLVTRLGGTTPKFDCVLDGGEKIRVKYGTGSEVPSEAAATRLVSALGFAADTVTLVERLRCYGCPPDPFAMLKAVDVAQLGPLFEHAVDYSHVQDYEWVAVERKFDGEPIETESLQGWAFYELDQVDPARGGAPRAHVDALKLLAAFLAHWDNKASNQRLVCVSREWPQGTACPDPRLVMQDLGAAFGPRKVDLDGWATTGIWGDRAACRLTMRALPYSGATFRDTHVGEQGRQFLSERLRQLSDAQMSELFAGARFDQRRALFKNPRPVQEWVHAFRARLAMIIDGPPCPAP
jgi:hypothetical protein